MPASFANHHACLREGTAALHGAVEVAVYRNNPFTSIRRYRRFILGNLAFFRAFETWAEASGVTELLDDWDERRKQDLLLADARDLAAYPDEVPPTPPELLPPAGASPAILLGSLYVTEGSTLGAAILAKHVRRLGLGPQNGGRYLNANSHSRLGYWRTFLEVLNTTPFDPPALQDAVDSARLTFNAYRRCVVPR